MSDMRFWYTITPLVFLVFFYFASLHFSSSNVQVCSSRACEQYANHLLSGINTSVDPCVDFGRYAAGNARPIKDYNTEASTLQQMDDDVEDLLTRLLHGSTFVSAKNARQSNFNTLQRVWNVCMDGAAIANHGIQSIQDILNELNQVFPRTGTQFSDITAAVTWLHRHAGNGLFSVDIMTNASNPDAYVLNFGGPSLFFPKYQYTKSPGLLKHYTEAIVEVLNVFSPDNAIRAQNVVDFEKRLSSLIADPSVANNVSYTLHTVTLSEIQDMDPEIQFIDYLRAILPNTIQVTPALSVNVDDFDYYSSLQSIFKQTARETIHDFFVVFLLRELSSRVDPALGFPFTRVWNIQNGLAPDVVEPRERTCLRTLKDILPHLVSELYSRDFTQQDQAKEVVSNVQDAVERRVQKTPWLSNYSRHMVVEKLHSIVVRIGYQTTYPVTSNSDEIQHYYNAMNLSSNDSWFEILQKAYNFSTMSMWLRFQLPVDRSTWDTTTAATVNAYYSPSGNSVTLPAAIMRHPIFDPSLPDYVTYGSFGALVGHELTHAFDDNGSQFNGSGFAEPCWDESTRVEFLGRAQCYVEQYSAYTVGVSESGQPSHLDGKLTLSENIADANGLDAAYDAWIRKNGNNPKLPGFRLFDADQMFFLAFANLWRATTRDENDFVRSVSDAHSTAGMRIQGPIENSPAFIKAFNCPIRSTCTLFG